MRMQGAHGIRRDRSVERARRGARELAMTPAMAGAMVIAIALAMAAFAAAAADPAPSSAPSAQCPEHCGEVLRVCLEETRKRHECLALTDACVHACKGGAVVLDDRGEVVPGWRFREGEERTRVRW